MATLRRFDVEASGKTFTIRFEDDKGRTVELSATRDQLDMMADALDDVLLSDNAGDDSAE